MYDTGKISESYKIQKKSLLKADARNYDRKFLALYIFSIPVTTTVDLLASRIGPN